MRGAGRQQRGQAGAGGGAAGGRPPLPGALAVLLLLSASPLAQGDAASAQGLPQQPTRWGAMPGLPPQQPGDVVVLRRAGISAYEEVLEGFKDNSRVRVRQVPIEDGPLAQGEALRRVGAPHLVVALGQTAVNVAAGTPAQIVYAMAPDSPASAISADYEPPIEALFKALREVRPTTRRIGVVAGRRGAARLSKARRAARILGLALIERTAEDGAQAVRALRDLSALSGAGPGPGQRTVDALWIGADPQLLTPPVLQYVLQLQLRTGLPLLAGTWQQVKSGAFLAVDWPPRRIGRRVAALVNLALDGVPRPDMSGREDPAGAPAVIMNRLIASKLGVDVDALKAQGWQVL